MKTLRAAFLTAFLVIASCAQEESKETQSSTVEKKKVEKMVEIEPTQEPTTEPTPTPEELKLVLDEISSLKTDFERAISKKNLDTYHKTKKRWSDTEKKINALTEKYGMSVIYNSPVKDCEDAFFHMYQAYVVFWGGATNPQDEREKRNYEEDRDKFKKLFDECKTSVETGIPASKRNTAE